MHISHEWNIFKTGFSPQPNFHISIIYDGASRCSLNSWAQHNLLFTQPWRVDQELFAMNRIRLMRKSLDAGWEKLIAYTQVGGMLFRFKLKLYFWFNHFSNTAQTLTNPCWVMTTLFSSVLLAYTCPTMNVYLVCWFYYDLVQTWLEELLKSK